MRNKTHIVVLTLLMALGSASLSYAADSTLTSTLTRQVLQLNCSMDQVNGLNRFNYTLQNPTVNTDLHISGFTLTFPEVPANDFVVTQTPGGWIGKVVAIQHKIDWQWNTSVQSPDPADQLDPSESFQFAFTTALPTDSPTSGLVSAQGEYGFSGLACGPAAPINPEPMSMVLGLMGLGSVLGATRLRRK